MKHPILSDDRPLGAHRTRPLFTALIVLAVCLTGLAPRTIGVAQAAEPAFTGTTTKVPVEPGGTPVVPLEITTGPDHNLWLTVKGQAAIVKLTTNGVATKYTAGITPGAQGEGITAGSDGNVWFTEGGADTIGRITPGGTVTEFSTGITAGAHPDQISAGPDGNLWFAERGRAAVGRITPSGTITEFTTGLTDTTHSVAVGSDGNLWFGAWTAPIVARVTPAGVVTEFATMDVPGSIAAGPDGRIYLSGFVTAQHGSAGTVESLSTTGAHFLVKNLGTTITAPEELVTGPDGALWIAVPSSYSASNATILRVTTTGTLQSFDAGAYSNATSGMTIGPDGNVWTTAASMGNVARFGFAPAPSAPTGVTVTATGDAQVTLHWTAPTSDPDAPTTGFHITLYANGVAQPVRNFDASSTTRVVT